MLLLFEVEGVCDYLTLKVTSETDLDGASLGDVGWIEVGQQEPLAVSRRSHIVCVFIDASTAGLTTRFRVSRILGHSLALEDLGDIVVLVGTADFAPEAD